MNLRQTPHLPPVLWELMWTTVASSCMTAIIRVAGSCLSPSLAQKRTNTSNPDTHSLILCKWCKAEPPFPVNRIHRWLWLQLMGDVCKKQGGGIVFAKSGFPVIYWLDQTSCNSFCLGSVWSRTLIWFCISSRRIRPRLRVNPEWAICHRFKRRWGIVWGVKSLAPHHNLLI